MAITAKDITICGHGGGRPSLKVMPTYLNSRYNSRMSNGLRKGALYVMRFKNLTDQKRQEFHDTYKTILGRNYYSQDRRGYVYTKYRDGYYYSDCSSSGCATLKKIGYNISLLNTVGIYESSLFEKVPVKIVNGQITNPEILKVGDAILFAGNSSRPWCQYIGHVEWVYEIKGKVIYKEDATPSTTSTTTTSTTKTNVPYLGIITANALNVRSGVGTSYNVIRTITQNTPVYITKEQDNWGYIGDGWVSLKYVTKKASMTGKVIASALNVRKEPVSGAIIKAIRKNTKVTITKLDLAGAWGYDSISKGWVSLKYIKF